MSNKSIFNLKSDYSPAGDQPEAIRQLTEGIKKGLRKQTLLGATGTGKTFTMAHVIANISKPTLVIAHNKTLAAQLAQEFREFFPDHAVHYFVSYYDYYQPEAYMPVTDTFIEKDAQINKEIDRLRHATTQALLTRKDVIIVASVSCLYGLGSPKQYEEKNTRLSIGDKINRNDLMRKLVDVHFERTNADLSPGQFRSTGARLDVMPVSETFMYSIELMGNSITKILKIDPITSEILETPENIFIFPAKHFITQDKELERAMKDIKKELELQLKKFQKEGKLLEVERIKRRTSYDLAMIREVGYCSGIENYSRHFAGKKEGEPPETLLSYFPHAKDGTPEFLTVIDESHVTLPQLQGMYAGDASRKQTLVEFGFRLPSAKDNRPLKYPEFEERIGQVVYVSATPSLLERESSDQVVEQIIRPTGLLDPVLSIRPIVPTGAYKGQIQDFIDEARKTIVGGGRVLATTLTKKMAEDLASYLKELPPEKGKKINSEYLHSDIKTMDRIKILSQFRRGEFDCLVGVNLLREGLDLPEVELIGILDADKEGFLRSETSLIQTIGRAARNSKGHVVLYADNLTGSMDRAIKETNRRREIQIAYNKKHKITPTTIKKNIKDITEQMESEHGKAVNAELALDVELFKKAYAKELNKPAKSLKGALEKRYMSDEERELMVYEKIVKLKEKEMSKAVKELDFETAAILRDEIVVLKRKLEPKS
ncbi:MAG: excinuclease ABC subunit UvrB [Candidatus Pacebacteria bacterium]|nr:excinuclease ABC subunit UvrB [Candidatus Paceibacterota bacterium]MBP9781019.1 excinuclease ABC subunit UvrB [Candidatus Paceibacterota bacterium]